MDVSPDTFRGVIDAHAASQPRAPFLIAPEPGLTISYRALRDAARRLDAGLARDGIAPGDVVAFMLPNGVSAALPAVRQALAWGRCPTRLAP